MSMQCIEINIILIIYKICFCVRNIECHDYMHYVQKQKKIYIDNNTEGWCFIDRFMTYRATELYSGVTKYFFGSVEDYFCLSTEDLVVE